MDVGDDNESVTTVSSIPTEDTPALRKARGAFFTPTEITHYIARWAIRSTADHVFEPSAGDAEFLVAAVHRLQTLAGYASPPTVDGVEIHAHSARVGRARVRRPEGTAPSKDRTSDGWGRRVSVRI